MYVLSFSLPICGRVDTLLPVQVIKESGELALSWVKNYAYDLCITNRRLEVPLKVPETIDIHLHLPAGRRMDRVLVLQWCVPFLLQRCSSAAQDSDPSSI
jgi:hypothetical protein